MPKTQLNNVCSKYRNLPDAYYGGDSSMFISPDRFKPIALDAAKHKSSVEKDSQSLDPAQISEQIDPLALDAAQRKTLVEAPKSRCKLWEW